MEERLEFQTLLDAEAKYNEDKELNYFDVVRDTIIHLVEREEWGIIRKILTHYGRQDNPNRGTLRTILMVLKPLRHGEEIKEECHLAAEKLRDGSTHGII